MTYWAAKPPLEASREIFKRIDHWYQWLRITGVYSLWLRSLREYYAGVNTGGQLGVGGENDEILTTKENHLHNIGENIVVMTTGARPSFEPKAKNSDHSSASQVIIAAGLLDNAHREKDLEGIGIQVTRHAGCLFGEGFASAVWDPGAGQEYALNPDSGAAEHTGDVKLRAHLPIDVARDHTKTEASDHQWYAVRRWLNRYDLLAKRPELRDLIMSLPSRWEESRQRPTLTSDWKGIQNTDTDDVACWEWYHAKTDAMPAGRMMTLCSETCILFDGPLAYDEVPVYRMVPEDLAGTQLGYWTLVDLLAPQHVVNSLDSTITSGIANVGYGSMWVKSGSNVTVEDVSGQFKLIRSAEKPEPLNLLEIPAIVSEFKGSKIEAMEAISGVNSARRGTLVNDKAMSGAALALVDAKAIEFSKGLERGYVKWLEQMATAIIRLYKRYATLPQVALVAGKSNRPYMKEFTSSSLDRIERVTVDLGNPLARTTSGRLSLAQMFIEMGQKGTPVIKTPEQLIQVLATGRLEPVIEGETAELMNIRAENEALGDGNPVRALAIDHHPKHIMEHQVVLASPEARSPENGAIAEAALAHIQEHIALWQSTDPNLLAALGIPPPPVAAPVQPPGSPPGPGGGPPPDAGAPLSGRVPAPDGMGAPLEGAMPLPPINPQTGERVQMPIPGA
ncbi:MAG TPA: hypothetical protein VFP50_18235 [Anaeromyxobacteraceae bacterium]|nr:hypothetical protein [Anaeromyxobacteraceae bacterium]